jgi:endoglucanase
MPAMRRRTFLRGAIAGAGAFRVAGAAAAPAELPEPSPARLPRWRGFNLLEKFTLGHSRNGPFVERDFEWIARWGFDFVRLPMDYRCWANPAEGAFNEEALKQIDQAIAWGRSHRIHVNLNFHRGPGYCVNAPKEPLSLWADAAAQEQFARHWGVFAKRYRQIPNRELSFDLLNEPAGVENAVYAAVVEKAVKAIRAESPDRLIIADGNSYGNKPVPELAPLKIAQSTRGYQPFRLTHYKASWAKGSDSWPEPSWPMRGAPGQAPYDRDRHWREQVEPWKKLEALGVGVHVGEWGAYQHTPHKVVLAWMKDMLDNWKKAGWGWALWNFRGSFGVLDSGRKDVAYEDHGGHKLDAAMLELLRSG